jgi:hypothetical protein
LNAAAWLPRSEIFVLCAVENQQAADPSFRHCPVFGGWPTLQAKGTGAATTTKRVVSISFDLNGFMPHHQTAPRILAPKWNELWPMPN